MSGEKIVHVCGLCGSQNVRRDAFAEWDEERQEWSLSRTFDEAFCSDCDETVRLKKRNAQTGAALSILDLIDGEGFAVMHGCDQISGEFATRQAALEWWPTHPTRHLFHVRGPWIKVLSRRGLDTLPLRDEEELSA